MTGLVKPKKYDWKDSNMELFGSDTDRQVKKESAEEEPAWTGAGQEVGLKVWRIVKFEVAEWPQEDVGKFFSGDSYIILNTYKPDPDSEALDFDVHFWIGKHSTQDEYGTAAYKTVELDTFLDDRAVQHREVQGHESELFKTYFDTITYMEGGSDSGFRHVEPEEYQPRLFIFTKQGSKIVTKQIPLTRDRVKNSDVYILDLGLTMYQWNGSECSPFEKNKASDYLSTLKEERGGRASSEVLDEADISDDHDFYAALTGEDEDDEDEVDEAGDKKLFRVSDEDGSLDTELVKEGEVSKGDLESKDVFLVDCGNELFVWVGNDASPAEKKNGMAYAHKYLSGSTHPCIPVTVVGENAKNQAFESAMAA